jgi:hypothetical protein
MSSTHPWPQDGSVGVGTRDAPSTAQVVPPFLTRPAKGRKFRWGARANIGGPRLTLVAADDRSLRSLPHCVRFAAEPGVRRTEESSPSVTLPDAKTRESSSRQDAADL